MRNCCRSQSDFCIFFLFFFCCFSLNHTSWANFSSLSDLFCPVHQSRVSMTPCSSSAFISADVFLFFWVLSLCVVNIQITISHQLVGGDFRNSWAPLRPITDLHEPLTPRIYLKNILFIETSENKVEGRRSCSCVWLCASAQRRAVSQPFLFC